MISLAQTSYVRILCIMIQLVNLSKEFADRILFDEVNITVARGEKIGLVGRNGMGKTTLFKMIVGEVGIDEGEIIIPKNYKLGYLKQHIQFNEKTILAECIQCLSEEEAFDHYKAEKILMGLGFSKEDFEKSPHDLSGGQQIRVNLAKVLITNPNMLLLDEPTNYLDIVSVRWLTRFLNSFQGEIILITHDREFMNQVTNSIMGIHRRKVIKLSGNVEKYLAKIREEEEIYESTRINQEKKRKELEGFIDKFRAKANKAAQAQSRVKMLEKMEVMEQLENISNLNFKFNFSACPGKELMGLKEISFGYNESHLLIDHFSLSVLNKDRIAIIGKNGKGKSTLLNIIAGELTPLSGERTHHPSLQMGHFGQTNIERLYPEHDIEQEIYNTNTDLSVTQTRNICATMMFGGDDAKKKIKVLSGGEKSRVLLGKILVSPTNLLLLDEPTNHLDQESIEVLTHEILNYQGASIIVTHSEKMLSAIATKLIIFHKNKVEVFNGTYNEFLAKIGWEEDDVQADQVRQENNLEESGLSYKEAKQLRAKLILDRSKATKPFKKQVDDLESKIVKHEEELEKLNLELLEASEAGKGDAISLLSKKIHDLNQSIENLFLDLELKSNELSEIEADYEKQLLRINS